jgi:hypothetical protein
LRKKKDLHVRQMDLWAHFRELAATYEHDQLPPLTSEEREPGEAIVVQRPRRPRRLSERAQFALLRNWLLRDYVPAYCRSLAATRIFRRCYWVDALGLEARAASVPNSGFVASGGKNRKKAGSSPLSWPPALQPIVALSEELAREPKPIVLYGLCLAAGSSRPPASSGKHKESVVASAAHNGAKPAASRESEAIPASWLEIAPTVLKDIEQAPALFLLNPLGTTLFSAEDLAPLYARAVPTELCLLLPHRQIESYLRAATTEPEQAVALKKLLRTDRWKTLPTTSEGQQEAVEGFVKLLSASLQRHFQHPVQVIRFPLLLGAASVEDAPFTLLFATRRPDSLYCMNDAISHYRRRMEEASYRGVLSEEWFTEQQQERYQAALQRLAGRIRQQVEAQRRVRWPDLRHHLLLAYFGQFPLQDYDATIQQLLVNREVYCAWRSPAPESAEERIPGNDDTLIWR